MKLNEKDVDIESTETLESIDFSLDMSSLGVLMKGFSDNLYSNKIGSVVREIASNCFDAHAEINNPEPVVIDLRRTADTYEIAFIDYGPGLSPERIREVYSRYFSSTKRGSNNEIGGFGIGAKSPFSYTDSFLVKTWVDGTEYHYIMHRGVTVPEIKLIFKTETDRKNGTEVCIPVKNQDVDKFRTELRKQLKYFDNIDYQGECRIDNDYSIVRYGPLIMREEVKLDDGDLEVCIGKVKYPLDLNQIPYPHRTKMSEVRDSVALHFDIGEVSVTMTRESIEYNEATVEAIVEKFNQAQTFVTGKYKESLIQGSINLSSFIVAVQDNSPRIRFTGKYGVYSLQVKGFLNEEVTKMKDHGFSALKGFDFLIFNSTLISSVINVEHCLNGKRVDLNDIGYSRRRKNLLRNNPRVNRLPSPVLNKSHKTALSYMLYLNEGLAGLPTYYRRKVEEEKLTEMKMTYISEEIEDDSLVGVINLLPFNEGFEIFEKACINISADLKLSREAYKKVRALVIQEIKDLGTTKSYHDIKVDSEWAKEWREARRTKPAFTFNKNEEIMTRYAVPGYNSSLGVSNGIAWKKAGLRYSEIEAKLIRGITMVVGTQKDVELLATVAQVVMYNQPTDQNYNSHAFRDYFIGLKRGQVVVVKVAQKEAKQLQLMTDWVVDVHEFIETPQFKKWALRMYVAASTSKHPILTGLSRTVNNTKVSNLVYPHMFDTLYYLREMSPVWTYGSSALLAECGTSTLLAEIAVTYPTWGVTKNIGAKNTPLSYPVSVSHLSETQAKLNELPGALNYCAEKLDKFIWYRYLISRGILPPNIKNYLELRKIYAIQWKNKAPQSDSAQEDPSAIPTEE